MEVKGKCHCKCPPLTNMQYEASFMTIYIAHVNNVGGILNFCYIHNCKESCKVKIKGAIRQIEVYTNGILMSNS